MDAFFAFLFWIMNLTGPAALAPQNAGLHQSQTDLNGVHIVNTNPRTVVALEDTHFRPNK